MFILKAATPAPAAQCPLAIPTPARPSTDSRSASRNSAKPPSPHGLPPPDSTTSTASPPTLAYPASKSTSSSAQVTFSLFCNNGLTEHSLLRILASSKTHWGHGCFGLGRPPRVVPFSTPWRRRQIAAARSNFLYSIRCLLQSFPSFSQFSTDRSAVIPCSGPRLD